MKALPDPWPLPKIAPEVLKRKAGEIASHGDLREKLADLGFVRVQNHRDRKLRKSASAIASFKTDSELKLWWQDLVLSMGQLRERCKPKPQISGSPVGAKSPLRSKSPGGGFE